MVFSLNCALVAQTTPDPQTVTASIESAGQQAAIDLVVKRPVSKVLSETVIGGTGKTGEPSFGPDNPNARYMRAEGSVTRTVYYPTYRGPTVLFTSRIDYERNNEFGHTISETGDDTLVVALSDYRSVEEVLRTDTHLVTLYTYYIDALHETKIGDYLYDDKLSNEYPTSWLFEDIQSSFSLFTGNYTLSHKSAKRDLDQKEWFYTVSKMKYKIAIAPGATRGVTWFEVFTPDDASQKKEFYPFSWDIALHPNGTETSAYVIDPTGVDPADQNRAIRHPMVNGKWEVVVYNAEPGVDANRDGSIQFASADASDVTTASSPYRFWINNDEDVAYNDWKWSDRDPEKFPPEVPDSRDQYINGSRDCEDLTRLWINATGLLESLKASDGDLYLGLKWKNISSAASPSIHLFRAADTTGGLGHIKNARIAAAQSNGRLRNRPNRVLGDATARDVATLGGRPWSVDSILTVEHRDRAADFIFRKEDLADLFGDRGTAFLLFEGVGEGAGELEIVVVKKLDNNAWQSVAECGSVWIKLDNIRRMYARAHSTPLPGDFPLPNTQTSPPVFPYVESSAASGRALSIPDSRVGFADGDTDEAPSDFPFVSTPGEEKKCIVFVHGIDMSVPAMNGYADSFYKRLWWEGFRGRLVVFRWSTTLSGVTDDVVLQNLAVFNSGQYRSLQSGESLKQFVADLQKTKLGVDWRISLLAHSLGNACASEAIRRGMQVERYVAMEPALSLSSFYALEASPPTNPRLLNAEAQFTTPQYSTMGGYHGYFKDVALLMSGNVFTYYNGDDFWLTTGHSSPLLNSVSFALSMGQFHVNEVNWIYNEEAQKPDNRWGPGKYNYGTSIIYPGTNAFFEYGIPFTRLVKDPAEVMSYVSRSRTLPLGAIAPPDPITGRDLTGYGFNVSRIDHSGQFQRSIQMMYGDENGVPWNQGGRELPPLFQRILADLGF